MSRFAMFVIACVAAGGARSLAQVPTSNVLARVPVFEVVDLAVPNSPDEPFSLEVPIDGQLVTLDLVRHSVHAPNFELRAQIEDGSLQVVPPFPIRTFRGTVQSIDGAIVAGSLLDDGLRAMIALPDGETYWIEPLDPSHTTLGAIGSYVVYRGADVPPDDRMCGVDDSERPNEEVPGEELGITPGGCGSGYCVAEIGVDTDVEFYFNHGSSLFLASSYIDLLLNVSNVVYERDVSIRHEVTWEIIRTAEPDPYNGTTADQLLTEMRNWWNANMGGGWDVAHLFSGKAIGPVIGLAWLGVVCDNSMAYSMSASDHFRDFRGDADTVTHELGHNWNADHCTCANPPYTMNPGILCVLRFHPTLSIPSIVNFRNGRGCLRGAPINDEARGALVVCNGTYTGTTAGASNDGESSCGSSSTAPDVWYVYRAPSNGTLTLDTCGSAYDTVISVHTDWPGYSRNEIACSDDNNACGPDSRQSRIDVAVTGGRSYWIRVSGYNNANGAFTLNVTGPGCFTPINDSCANAIAIGPGMYFGNTSGATNDGSATRGNSNTTPDVWYRYRPRVDGVLIVDTCDSGFDTVLSVHSSCPGTVANELASSDDDVCGRQSRVELNVVAFQAYYIRVSGFSGWTGAFKLGLTGPRLAEDDCGTMRVVTDGRYYGSFVGASNDGPATCGNRVGQRDLWFLYSAPRNGTLRVDTCGTNDLENVDVGADTVLTLHSSCPVPGNNFEIACNDNMVACGSLDQGWSADSVITWPVTSGQQFIIRASMRDGTRPGPFVLNVRAIPPNDLCANAQAVYVGQVTGTTEGADADGGDSCVGGGQPDVWYRYEGTCNSTLHVTTCGTEMTFGTDTCVSVHRGCPGTPDNEIGCNDDWQRGNDSQACGSQAYIRDSAVAVAITYEPVVYIRVANYHGTQAGRFLLNVWCSNSGPTTPGAPSGPTRSVVGLDVGFSASAFDPDVDLIRYTFNWGDGTTSTSDPTLSGGQVTLHHTYATEGIYQVTVRADDGRGNQSPFSSPSTIDIADANCRLGNVDVDNGGPPVDVLSVNGSAGIGPARLFAASASAPIEVTLNPAPAGPTGVQARYAVWVWRTYPTSATDVDAPYGIGRMAMNPMRTSCGSACAAFAAKNIGGFCNNVLCSTPQATGAWPPGVVMRIPAGTLNSGETIFVQGVIRDSSDTSGKLLSVTNGVEVMIVQ